MAITTSLKLFFLLLHFSTRLQAYTSEEVFTINCGTTGKSSDGQRTWTGDEDTKYLTFQDTTVSDKAITQSPSANQVPFSTARLSRSQFNYSFPVSPGSKFLRLFFYPADYSFFPRTQASFHVQSNQFTLLNAFNASLNTDAQATDTVFREYVVNVNDGERLILTFTPSHPNSYAFINGIEVLSMPTDLYYTPENDTGFTNIGISTLYSVGTSFALQTEYRIKAGGQEILPYNDSGLFRDWAAEERYFIKYNPENDDLLADMDGKMNITVNPDYVAPKELFRTARSMGRYATLNRMSNLTWEFPVDCGFTYVLRLHFCELDPYINDIGDRQFYIYIASQLAEVRADVMKWSQKQKGLVVHKNYAVFIPQNGSQKKFNLSLQMQPDGSNVDSKYANALLNGLEIFKISNSNNLAGPNPDPVQTPQNNIPGQNGKTIAGVLSGVVLILIIVFLVVFLRYKRNTYTKSRDCESKSTTIFLPTDLCRRFSFAEMRAATQNFDEVLIVGTGGFGQVYKGYIDEGSVPVAIKRLKPDSQQGAREFLNEIKMLSQLRHLNVVSLIGYCNDNKEMILVYDFITRGNLRDHLYNTDNPAISWKQRLQICIGAARGLHYLHTGAKHTIIHRDVKSTNILLDDNLSPQTMAILTLFFFLLPFSTHLQAYIPEEVFTINCGTTGNSSDGQRTWTGDADTKYLSSQDITVSDKAPTQSPSANQVPFSTARLSSSQFNYSFPVSPGTKFIRLFFYPADYPSFPRTHASFSVLSNQFTLLNDFNASLNADAQVMDTIFKEYVVNVNDGERLILTFTPSFPNSYVFINGIEVLSMPTDLYYTPENETGFTFFECSTLYSIGTSFALQTEYRIKSGWQVEIPPQKDTGLFRNWVNEKPYFIEQNSHLNDVSTDYSNMTITVNPYYVAPKELFRTARSMGTNATFNRMRNLTWEFPVDCGFTYVLRLHFCELDPYINDIGDRRFFIYIASQLAEPGADVMKWTQKQKGLAVHKNYAVLIPNIGTQKKFNLSLQMHPSEHSRYSDAFLNGVEIFKVSQAGSNSLAGPNPDPSQTPDISIHGQNGKIRRGSGTDIIEVDVGLVSGVVLISLAVFLVAFLLYKRTPYTKSKDYECKSTTTRNSSLPTDLCRRFSLDEMRAATQNFDKVFIIGTGGFGQVYKGYIDEGSVPVAIKRLKRDSQQGPREFSNEINMLSQLRHLNVVSLIGYCNDNKEMILVYDFMTRGNLRDHLYNTDNPPISWKQRLHICIGAAHGLNYLHTGAKHTIIHRDVKTTNILLDDKWVAKVSDFGLSRLGPIGTSKTHVSTDVKGSFGYLDPEYYKRYRLTEKSDVYSFGVVLFEILCGRPPLIHSAERQQVSLSNWVRHCYESGTIAEIVEPTLKKEIAAECLKKFCEIGVSCLLEDGSLRPSMEHVAAMLEFTLELQESAEQRQNVNVAIPN
ncbi:receptor-like protein kinase FERONIA [Vigna umbellata]|uniref:receptor-like protein kinase FERONIA n=1 Tax=Vigna umbellata TaxID=87088 RepID=UPI001F5E61CE|nr:receptor-like protein kinase FERONIA [Vigna umbellata]